MLRGIRVVAVLSVLGFSITGCGGGGGGTSAISPLPQANTPLAVNSIVDHAKDGQISTITVTIKDSDSVGYGVAASIVTSNGGVATIIADSNDGNGNNKMIGNWRYQLPANQIAKVVSQTRIQLPDGSWETPSPPSAVASFELAPGQTVKFEFDFGNG